MAIAKAIMTMRDYSSPAQAHYNSRNKNNIPYNGGQGHIYSQLSRLNTTRGSGTGPVTLKYMACKSVLFTDRFPDVKIKDTWLTKLTQFIIYAMGGIDSILCYVVAT